MLSPENLLKQLNTLVNPEGEVSRDIKNLFDYFHGSAPHFATDVPAIRLMVDPELIMDGPRPTPRLFAMLNPPGFYRLDDIDGHRILIIYFDDGRRIALVENPEQTKIRKYQMVLRECEFDYQL